MDKLTEKINQDLKQAMKSKDAETTSVLRMLIAALHNKEITLRPAFAKASAGEQDGKAELNEAQIVEVLATEIKKHRDSVEAYVQGGRPELALKESAEIKILEKYLPEKLADAELEKIVKEVVASGVDNLPAGQAGFGKVMGQVMAKVKGRAEGAKVGELVKKLLAK